MCVAGRADAGVGHRARSQRLPQRHRGLELLPNPAVTPGGWYLTSTGKMQYNAFETSVRVNRIGGLYTSLHYTLSKGSGQQGGNLVGNFNSSLGDAYFQTQDFFDPDLDIRQTLFAVGDLGVFQFYLAAVPSLHRD